MTQNTLANVSSTVFDPEYTGLLGELGNVRSRVEAARITADLSSVAKDVTAALRGPGLMDTDDEDTGRDPVAWADITTYLLRISLALSYGTYDTAGWDEQDDAAEWKALSEAVDRAKFTAAWSPIAAALAEKTVPAEVGAKPRLRRFAVDQTLAVARAVTGANW